MSPEFVRWMSVESTDHLVSLPKRSVTKVTFRLLILAIVLLLCPAASSAKAPQPREPQEGTIPIYPRFMNMIVHSPGTWPTVPFESVRLWDTHTRWSDLNPAPGQYDWSVLDRWLDAGQKHNSDFLFTLAMTPQWASSNPNDQICNYGPGQCDAPNDVNPDGTGTDLHWKTFVTAVARHVGTRIRFWEIWNEPNNLWYWNGTAAQLARMAQDAHAILQAINPDARTLNAGTGAHRVYGLKWWNAYAAAGGLQWADIIALHGDVRDSPPTCGVYPQAETFGVVMQNLRAVLTQYGQQNKPVWDTEASWGRTDQDCFYDQDLQAAFLARFYLLHRSERIRRFWWRGWIDGDGGIYNEKKGQLNKAGVAYTQIHDWMVGSTLNGSCTPVGTVWTCNLTRTEGYAAQVVWDTSQTCKNGDCSTTSYSVGPQFVSYRTLDCSKIPIKGHRVPIGAKPILMEN